MSARHTFNQVAALYDRARPGYPDALFDDIIILVNLPQKARILEVGCGSGQATLPLAKRGYAIDCIEPGGQLAAIARDKLAAYPKVTVIQADFETVSLVGGSYDLVLSATAFHWIDPDIRFRKAHDLLKPGGSIALFWNLPVQTEASQHYIEALQQVYQRVVPQMSRDFQSPPHPDCLTTAFADAIPESGWFGDVTIRRHLQAIRYTAKTYIDLLETFSDHRLLETSRRQQLFDDIARLIETEFNGALIRETAALLYLANPLPR